MPEPNEERWGPTGNDAVNIHCQCGNVYDYSNYSGLNTGSEKVGPYLYLFPVCPKCHERLLKKSKKDLDHFQNNKGGHSPHYPVMGFLV